MEYEMYKSEVSDFFESHIMKYIVSDLEVLDAIQANSDGIGGCAIPQAVSTFAALDLLGFLISPQEIGPVKMHFVEILKNDNLFRQFNDIEKHDSFFESFRDDIRSVMTHRYSLTQYDITKSNENVLFYSDGEKTVFNVSYFTKGVVNAIRTLYSELTNDNLTIPGNNKNQAMQKFYEKVIKLRTYKSVHHKDTHFGSIADPPQTTESLKRD
jgi:hypothetical protein